MTSDSGRDQPVAALDELLRARTIPNGIGILANNAAILVPIMLQDYAEADFDRQISTNFKGLF